MKTYEILNIKDFNTFLDKIASYISSEKQKGRDFPKMIFTVKKLQKDKTPQQHRFYWVVIGEMVKAFKEAGYDFTSEEVHEFIKRKSGYIERHTLKNGEEVFFTKSIANSSDDVNIKVMMNLIDYAIEWTAINLGYTISDPRK